MDSKQLYQELGDRILLISYLLQKSETERLEEYEHQQLLNARTFLHDHKYQLSNQGLNEVESVILAVEIYFKNLD